MKKLLLLSLFLVPLALPSNLFAYTVYSDMAGSEIMRVYGYSYTDLSGSDWHYRANIIFQRMWDPNGAESSAYGGSTYASMYKNYTVDGDYNVLSRHEMTCTLYGVPVTPYSGGAITISATKANYEYQFGSTVAYYRVCSQYNVPCPDMAVFPYQRPPGIGYWPSFLQLFTLNARVYPLPTVCYIINSKLKTSCTDFP